MSPSVVQRNVFNMIQNKSVMRPITGCKLNWEKLNLMINLKSISVAPCGPNYTGVVLAVED